MKLIFIHGSGGCKESWQFQTDTFKNSEAVNLPGHPDGELCPTIGEYAVWLHDYIKEKGYKDVVLAGHSLGGGIVLQYALENTDRVKGVILVGSGARLRVHPRFIEALEAAVKNPALMLNFTANSYDLIEPELAAVLKKRTEENGPAPFLNDMKACDQFDVMERIGALNLPVLAVCGDQDIMTPPKYSTYLADNMPHAKAVIIPGGTHFVFAEKPNEVNQAIETFLQEIL